MELFCGADGNIGPSGVYEEKQDKCTEDFCVVVLF